jgi:lipoate-protein ligase B
MVPRRNASTRGRAVLRLVLCIFCCAEVSGLVLRPIVDVYNFLHPDVDSCISNTARRLLPYKKGLDIQKALLERQLEARKNIDLESISNNYSPLSSSSSVGVPCGSIIICEHTPTYTFGTGTCIQTSGPFKQTLTDQDTGAQLPRFECVPVDRAGHATFHGPGQIVLYPILDLRTLQRVKVINAGSSAQVDVHKDKNASLQHVTDNFQDIHEYLRLLEEIVIDACSVLPGVTKAGRLKGFTGFMDFVLS